MNRKIKKKKKSKLLLLIVTLSMDSRTLIFFFRGVSFKKN
jgi:hypothetical protein